MWIKGKWYTEPEISARIEELEGMNVELEDKHWDDCRLISEYDIEVKELRKLLTCLRSYFGSTVGWVDLFEEQAAALLEGVKNENS
jgi:hypothetical protein